MKPRVVADPFAVSLSKSAIWLREARVARCRADSGFVGWRINTFATTCTVGDARYII